MTLGTASLANCRGRPSWPAGHSLATLPRCSTSRPEMLGTARRREHAGRKNKARRRADTRRLGARRNARRAMCEERPDGGLGFFARRRPEYRRPPRASAERSTKGQPARRVEARRAGLGVHTRSWFGSAGLRAGRTFVFRLQQRKLELDL